MTDSDDKAREMAAFLWERDYAAGMACDDLVGDVYAGAAEWMVRHGITVAALRGKDGTAIEMYAEARTGQRLRGPAEPA